MNCGYYLLLIVTGQVFAQNIYSNKSEFLLTNQSPKTEDDSYMGYSIASIDLVSDQTKVSGIVVGVPRGNSLVGKVAYKSTFNQI